MSSIAARYGTTVKKLSALNGIKDPSLIHPGQILKLR
jgi:LysM repeat protein